MGTEKVNTLYADVICPFCHEKVSSGVGFKVGALTNKAYKLGDKLDWSGTALRPDKQPAKGNITSIGYFNCDNVHCSTWQDCYPEVQQAFIKIENNVIVSVTPVEDSSDFKSYEITEAS
ncbi:MAG TPA: hypothetical protein V6C97_17020 [Oculatellaceae cyanobacterium]